MAKVLMLLRDEHRSIAAVLHGMEYLMNEIREHGVKVDLKVFWAMLYYLDTFSGRMHHPKEDEYLFKSVLARTREADAVIDELEREHAAGAEALKQLEQGLARYQEGGAKEFRAFSHEVDRFVRDYWEHMRKEEELVLPVAERVLSAADREAIDQAFEQNRDPLAAERETKDFQRLFRRIVNLAPPPIGVGPDPAR
jgi:hemerythrin-like domain-containing protein